MTHPLSTLEAQAEQELADLDYSIPPSETADLLTVLETLTVMTEHIALSEWGDVAVVPEHVRTVLRGRHDWPWPEAWPSITWKELAASLTHAALLRGEATPLHGGEMTETPRKLRTFISRSPSDGTCRITKDDVTLTLTAAEMVRVAEDYCHLIEPAPSRGGEATQEPKK